jgi:hypothetical protein
MKQQSRKYLSTFNMVGAYNVYVTHNIDVLQWVIFKRGLKTIALVNFAMVKWTGTIAQW